MLWWHIRLVLCSQGPWNQLLLDFVRIADCTREAHCSGLDYSSLTLVPVPFELSCTLFLSFSFQLEWVKDAHLGKERATFLVEAKQNF